MPAPVLAPRPATVQRFGGNDAFAVDPVRLGLNSGGGRPLPDAVRGTMEAVLGADFSAVRVHVGPQAERIGAIAFTTGNDIYFAPGRFQPDTLQGRQLLGHELAHVVQQRKGQVDTSPGKGIRIVQDRMLEAEADRLGRIAANCSLSPKSDKSLTPVRVPTSQNKATGKSLGCAPIRMPHFHSGGIRQSSNLQMDKTIAEEIMDYARAAGARFRSALSWFSLNRSSRKRISWFSKGIQESIGVAPKPKSGDICPGCGQAASAWQLDHINPWRQFVAATVDPSEVQFDGTDIWIDINQVRALYNDPDNLKWFCRGCNGKKSDYTLDKWDASWASRLNTRGRDLDLPTFMGL
ncbi:MAG: DUF4157 domain-containing protein [Paracraurococcus sp.]